MGKSSWLRSGTSGSLRATVWSQNGRDVAGHGISLAGFLANRLATGPIPALLECPDGFGYRYWPRGSLSSSAHIPGFTRCIPVGVSSHLLYCSHLASPPPPVRPHPRSVDGAGHNSSGDTV